MSFPRFLRSATFLVALVTIVVGIVGIISPSSLTAIRRVYFATPGRIYAAGAVRLAMGLVVILAAPSSRAPRILRVLGVVMCLQTLTPLFAPDRARAILEWEAIRDTALLRAGAAVSFAAGVFLAFAVSKRPSITDQKR